MWRDTENQQYSYLVISVEIDYLAFYYDIKCLFTFYSLKSSYFLFCFVFFIIMIIITNI